MIARPRCPDRKRTAPCRPTNRKKSTRSRVEKGAPFRVKGGAALPVQKGARFRGVYQLRQGRFREGAGNRRSAGRARLQMLDRAARCAPGPLLRRLDHQGHRAGAVLHSCAVEREQQLGFRLARDRARREQEQAHFHGARGGRAGRRRRSSCSSPRRNGSTPSRGGWRPISTSSRNSLPTMTTSRPRKTGGLRRAPARAGLLGARPMCSEEGPPFLPRSRSARSFSRGRLATSRLSAKHA